MTMAKFRVPALVAALCALLSLAGCDEHVICHSYRHVPRQGWNRRDTFSFDIDTVRAEAAYKFALGLRLTGSYPYTDICLAVERKFSNPDTACRDTVRCRLTDSITHRMGKGVHIYQYDAPVSSMTLHRGQTGQVRVIHLAGREILSGIRDVGILVSR